MSNLNEATTRRASIIIKTSIIGIITNIVLAGFKATLGILSNSIAITTDAINNLSDAMSSIITIIGTKLAGKTPDKKHPLGYGRIEYLSATIIAALVLYAGITSLVESVKNIIKPSVPSYTPMTLLILFVGIITKVVLGTYVRKKGESVNSGSLIASGADALNDAILSASVLASTLIYYFFHVSLEAYVGVILSIIIIKSGIEMMIETLDKILGERITSSLSKEVKKTISEDKDVLGAYDLVLHSYGPDKYVGAVHVEINDTMTAQEIDEMQRRLQKNVYLAHGIALTGISIYCVNTTDDEIMQMKSVITEIVMGHDTVLQMHGFYANTQLKQISFDVIIDYDNIERESLYKHIMEDIQKEYPDYHLNITMDADISD